MEQGKADFGSVYWVLTSNRQARCLWVDVRARGMPHCETGAKAVWTLHRRLSQIMVEVDVGAHAGTHENHHASASYLEEASEVAPMSCSYVVNKNLLWWHSIGLIGCLVEMTFRGFIGGKLKRR